MIARWEKAHIHVQYVLYSSEPHEQPDMYMYMYM